jgi:hypothetical protein
MKQWQIICICAAFPIAVGSILITPMILGTNKQNDTKSVWDLVPANNTYPRNVFFQFLEKPHHVYFEVIMNDNNTKMISACATDQFCYYKSNNTLVIQNQTMAIINPVVISVKTKSWNNPCPFNQTYCDWNNNHNNMTLTTISGVNCDLNDMSEQCKRLASLALQHQLNPKATLEGGH